MPKLRESFAFVKALYLARKYNPNQPRITAGNPDGGQWTSASAGRFDSRREIINNADKQQPWEVVSNTSRADGTIEQQTVLLRDGAVIRSEFAGKNPVNDWDERHLVMTPDGNLTVFENRGDVQTIKDANGQILGVSDWTRYGAQPEAFLQPAFLPPSPNPVVIGGAVALFTWLSSRNTPDSTAVFSFRAGLFKPGADRNSSAILGRVVDERASRRSLSEIFRGAKYYRPCRRTDRSWPL